jgi:hypothetical protein
MGVGSFTAQQLFLSSDSSHAWIVSNLPELLSFDFQFQTPASIPLAGGVTAYSGGITPDGTLVFLGASDGTVHRIYTPSSVDDTQIAVNLKDSNGNLTAPNLVCVLP